MHKLLKSAERLMAKAELKLDSVRERVRAHGRDQASRTRDGDAVL